MSTATRASHSVEEYAADIPEEASPGEISEEDVGCVTLPWAPTVVSFLNTVDPAKDWTRDMVEFVYCYWSQKFDDDERMPIKVGDFLSLTAADLGLSKHRTMDRWATAEVISVEETTSVSRQKKVKSQTICCRLADRKLYEMIVKKRPEMRGENGCLLKENFLYETREGARASIYLELKEKLKEIEPSVYRHWLSKREVPLSASEEENRMKPAKRKNNIYKGRRSTRGRGRTASSMSKRSRTDSVSSPLSSPKNPPSPSVSVGDSRTSGESPASPAMTRKRFSAKSLPEDSIESRVRRSSRHQRGSKLGEAELAKIIQSRQLQDRSAYGRYYKERRLVEEGGGPLEPPPTPVSPERIKGKPSPQLHEGSARSSGIRQAVREAVASVEIVPEVAVAESKGKDVEMDISADGKGAQNVGRPTKRKDPAEELMEAAEKKARSILSQPVVDREYPSRLDVIIPANRVRQRRKVVEGFASAVDKGVRADQMRSSVSEFARDAGERLEAKIFVKEEAASEGGWSKYLKEVSRIGKNLILAGGIVQIVEKELVSLDEVASRHCKGEWLKSIKENDEVLPNEKRWRDLYERFRKELLRQCGGIEGNDEEDSLAASALAMEMSRRCWEGSMKGRKSERDLRYYHEIEKIVRRIRGVPRLTSKSIVALAQKGKLTCEQLLESSVEEIQERAR